MTTCDDTSFATVSNFGPRTISGPLTSGDSRHSKGTTGTTISKTGLCDHIES